MIDENVKNRPESYLDLEDIFDKYKSVCRKWGEMEKLYEMGMEFISKKYHVYWLDYDADSTIFYFKISNEKYYCAIDGSRNISDYDVPKDNKNQIEHPKICKEICIDFCKMLNRIEKSMKVYCESLGFVFNWTDKTYSLVGLGVKTSDIAFITDPDGLIDNTEIVIDEGWVKFDELKKMGVMV